jgi:hypothetical protein
VSKKINENKRSEHKGRIKIESGGYSPVSFFKIIITRRGRCHTFKGKGFAEEALARRREGQRRWRSEPRVGIKHVHSLRERGRKGVFGLGPRGVLGAGDRCLLGSFYPEKDSRRGD